MTSTTAGTDRPRKLHSVKEFCHDHNICPTTFYAMLKDGTGPKTMKVRWRRFVADEDAAAWRAAMAK